MTLPSLLPLAGTVIAPVLEQVFHGVTDSLSFLDILHEQEQAGASDGPQTTESSKLQRDFVELADRTREKLAQLGIDLTTPLRLKQDGRERVVVDGDHPDRVLVESIFGNDKELSNLFKAVADSATSDRHETDSSITKEFRFVMSQTDERMEFA